MIITTVVNCISLSKSVSWLRLREGFKTTFNKCQMRGMFKMKHNPVLGKMEWELVDEDYDYHQEVARSAYADMLHDSERNEKYHVAVKTAIQKMHDMGKPAHVLDIGTGTGLLAMMAANCGADTVVACEAFQPMAKCAQKVIRDNRLSERIQLIPKRSTEIIVGKDGDMKHRANILVTEVFDTELIGEGAISTFNHAHKELLEPNSIVIPSEASMYVQIVECPLALSWHRPSPWRSMDQNAVITPPAKSLHCTGVPSVHDLQLSQLGEDSFCTIVPPTRVFRFDWSGKSGFIPEDRSETVEVVAEISGTAQVVFMWWDINMDQDGHVVLSCAPYWAHPSFLHNKNQILPQDSGIPWRDHWMQALYYLPSEVTVEKGEVARVTAHHDEYSLWFNFQKSSGPNSIPEKTKPPVCECGLHASFGRARIGTLNDEKRRMKYDAVLRNSLARKSVIGDGETTTLVCLSEGSMLGLFASKLAKKTFNINKVKVICEDGNIRSKKVVEDIIHENDLDGSVSVLEEISKDEHLNGNKIRMLFGEPHFYSSLLPWHNLRFWYRKCNLSNFLTQETILLPRGASIWATAVFFTDLWKIRAPVHSAEGFKMESFDQLIEASRSIGDDQIEPQPLWEYPCKALSSPVKLFDFDFQQSVPEEAIVKRGTFNVECDLKDCNGIAFWIDWDLDGEPEHVISTGPTVNHLKVGEFVLWDVHTRQGVRLLTPTSLPINFEARFLPNTCDLSLSLQSPMKEV